MSEREREKERGRRERKRRKTGGGGFENIAELRVSESGRMKRIACGFSCNTVHQLDRKAGGPGLGESRRAGTRSTGADRKGKQAGREGTGA